jgi:uncharacterized protein
MPRLLVVAAILAMVSEMPSSSPVGSEARAQEIIRELTLQVLPKELGYLGIIGRSALMVTVSGRPLAVQSQNYYMLTSARPINYLHWLEPDDTHILIEGGPVDYFILHPDGRAEKVTLGMNLAVGERPVVAIPGGCWKTLRLHDGVKYALMANTLSPEFTADRVRIGAGADGVKRYAGSAPWATPEALREIIGPNWLHKPLLRCRESAQLRKPSVLFFRACCGSITGLPCWSG